jgi:hypothetical protein
MAERFNLDQNPHRQGLIFGEKIRCRKTKIWLLRVSVGLGPARFYLLPPSWWFEAGRLGQPGLLLLLLCAVLYWGMQMAGNWILYLFAHRSTECPHLVQFSVDVFVTVYDEPYEMVERALAAACALQGEHKTWLLDDGHKPAFAALAQRLDAGYLTRGDRRNAKAGNLNAAMERTHGELVAIFDVDHVPRPTSSSAAWAALVIRHRVVQVMLDFR